MKIDLTPYGNRVFVKKVEQEEMDGLFIPSNSTLSNEPSFGKVIAVPEHRGDIKVGDTVMFAPAQSIKIYLEEQEFYLVSYDVIFAKM